MRKNTYFFMRHGRSQANEAGIIASDPEYCIAGYGLTDEGIHQAELSARRFAEQHRIHRIISSDFLRARMTAETAAAALSISSIETTPLLRERFFGAYNGRPDTQYDEIWNLDAEGSGHRAFGIETPDEVTERIRRLVDQCEEQYADENILFVAHGDVIQIGLCYFSGRSASMHRSIPHMQTAEIRQA